MKRLIAELKLWLDEATYRKPEKALLCRSLELGSRRQEAQFLLRSLR